MDWFLAAATGRDARWDALLNQHLAVLVAIVPLIPDPCGRRWQVFVQHIGTGEVTAIALHAGGSQGTIFAVAGHRELAGYTSLGALIRRSPLVEAGRRGTGFETSGVNHHHLGHPPTVVPSE